MNLSSKHLLFYTYLCFLFLLTLVTSFFFIDPLFTQYLSLIYLMIIAILLLLFSLSSLYSKTYNSVAITGSLFGSVIIFICFNLPYCTYHFSLNPHSPTLSYYFLFIYTVAVFYNTLLFCFTGVFFRYNKMFRPIVFIIVFASVIVAFIVQIFSRQIEGFVSRVGATPFLMLSALCVIAGWILCIVCYRIGYKYYKPYLFKNKKLLLGLFFMCQVILVVFGLRMYTPIASTLPYMLILNLICFVFFYIILRYSFIDTFQTVSDKLTMHEKNNLLMSNYLKTMSNSHKAISAQYTKIDAMYTQMMHFYPEPLVIIKNTHIIHTNAHALHLFQCHQQEKLMDQILSDFIHPEDQPTFSKALADLKHASSPTHTLEVQLMTFKSTYIPVSMFIALSLADTVHSNTYMVSIRDLTLVKKEEVLRKEVALEKVKVDFFSTISHELKTPVNIIYSALQLQNTFIHTNDYKQAFQYNTMISQNCLRLLRLLNNLLDINRIESDYFTVSPKPLNIVTFTESIMNSVSPYAAKKNIHCTFDTTDEEIYLTLDPDLYERTLLNLLSNAIKYGREEGHIFVGITKSVNEVILTIEDNGVGIPPHALDSIFTRFTRVENGLIRKAEGAGIGLSLVKSFVELNKGRIWVKSHLDEGTCFFMAYPLNPILSHLDALNLSKSTSEKVNIELSDIFI